VDRLRRASGASLAAKQGWTDVARLGQYGIPAVNFGPGRAAQAHQRSSSWRSSEIEATFAALRRVLTGDDRDGGDSQEVAATWPIFSSWNARSAGVVSQCRASSSASIRK
jgi:hypothetical protein